MNEPVNTVIGIDSTVIEYQWPEEGGKASKIFECAGTEERRWRYSQTKGLHER